jgi:hypothetical protein
LNAFHQPQSLRNVLQLSSGQSPANRIAQSIDYNMNFAA